MFSSQSITLVFLTDHGTKETMHLEHSSMYEARKLAGQVLRAGAGLYIRVEIDAGRTVETIDKPEPAEVGSGE
ncbi:MAG TPA: hypothetical protein VEU96_14430 [Bryobacteraceae bacterium]|nr:hypothetical protein [Bryobacteraceae bacterium]